MTRRAKIATIAALGLTVAIAIARLTLAQTQTETWRCRKPLTGSRPTLFEWSAAVPDSTGIFVVQTTSPDSVASFSFSKRDPHVVRVRCRDAAGRWSVPSWCSAPVDPGVPGQPGQPTRNTP